MTKASLYNVVIWHRVDSSPPGLHDRILTHSGRQPDEGIEMQGFHDMHWSFDSPDVAIAFAESLFEVTASEDVTLLSIAATHDDGFGRRVYKDTRSIRPRLV